MMENCKQLHIMMALREHATILPLTIWATIGENALEYYS